MTSAKPYLLRAFYEWIVDNSCTPYILVNATLPSVEVPRDFIEDGQIVLNLSPSAIVDLSMDNESVQFSARFGGVQHYISVPMNAIGRIYARENEQGIAFPDEEVADESDKPEPPPEPPRPSSGSKPTLKVVK